MACIFLSTGSGNIVGGILQGFWYGTFSLELHLPKVFFALIISTGFLTLICFIFYNRWIIQRTLAKDATAKVDTGIWTKTTTAGVVFLFIPITIYGAYLGGPDTFYAKQDAMDAAPDWANDYDLLTIEIMTELGQATENSNTDLALDLTREDYYNIESITFTLTWTDEPDYSTRHTNQPDEFSLTVQAPSSEDTSITLESGSDQSGSISLEYNPTQGAAPKHDPYYNGTGEYQITIRCGTCGDHELWRPSIGVQDQPDNGNTWTLNIDYSYYEKPQA
jgi:hypothetical protein